MIRNRVENMEPHRYYVTWRESVYSLAVVLGVPLLLILTYLASSWMIPGNPRLAEMIVRLTSVLKTVGVAIIAFFFWNFMNSWTKPKLSICPHFLIMGYFEPYIILWDEIYSVRISGSNLRVQLERDSRRITRKESIKYVKKKEDLIQRIKELCEEYQIDFSQK
jgi:hypothetical protein